MFIVTLFFDTLRHYPEIAIFLTLALGYYFGKFTFKGIGLGSVTATLLAGVLIGEEREGSGFAGTVTGGAVLEEDGGDVFGKGDGLGGKGEREEEDGKEKVGGTPAFGRRCS